MCRCRVRNFSKTTAASRMDRDRRRKHQLRIGAVSYSLIECSVPHHAPRLTGSAIWLFQSSARAYVWWKAGVLHSRNASQISGHIGDGAPTAGTMHITTEGHYKTGRAILSFRISDPCGASCRLFGGVCDSTSIDVGSTSFVPNLSTSRLPLRG